MSGSELTELNKAKSFTQRHPKLVRAILIKAAMLVCGVGYYAYTLHNRVAQLENDNAVLFRIENAHWDMEDIWKSVVAKKPGIILIDCNINGQKSTKTPDADFFKNFAENEKRIVDGACRVRRPVNWGQPTQ